MSGSYEMTTKPAKVKLHRGEPQCGDKKASQPETNGLRTPSSSLKVTPCCERLSMAEFALAGLVAADARARD